MNTTKYVHFIGIGGIGISALARHYHHEGWQVSGSDLVPSENTKKLEAEGIAVVYHQAPDNITPALSLVVYSDGVTKETAGWAELAAARESGIRTLSYFEALAEVANQYYLIAVAGTHGKTTTTAMLADILEEASFDPTVVVGSLRARTGTNYRSGKSKYFLVEADEYLRHFLFFTPQVLIINNIDFDHPDYFRDVADVQAAFTALVAKIPQDGFIIANVKDPQVVPVLSTARATVVDYQAFLNITRPLRQPGLHNRQNAAAAEAAATALGIEQRFIDTALENFLGTARRFEYKGDIHNAPVYDDYAHNPQKVAALIAGAREVYPTKQITIVFQPHTYSRTRALREAFVQALGTADTVVLLPIYAARETDDGSISSLMLADDLAAAGKSVEHFHTLEAAAAAVAATADSARVILCAGAGTVTKVAEILTSGTASVRLP